MQPVGRMTSAEAGGNPPSAMAEYTALFRPTPLQPPRLLGGSLLAMTAIVGVIANPGRPALSGRSGGSNRGVTLALFRVDALVNPGRPFVMPQIRLHPSRPRIARAGSAPGITLRDPGMLELVEGEVFGLALDNDKPASAEASGHR